MALTALVLGLVALHLWVAQKWGQLSHLAQQAQSLQAPEPARIEVAFVNELRPSAAPPAPPVRRAPVAAASPLAAPTPSPAASAPEPPTVSVAAEPQTATATEGAAASPPAAAEAPVATAGAPEPRTPSAQAEGAAAPTRAAAENSPALPVPAPAPFEWPPSTRLSYLLQGDYRGPVQGRATVEWLRSGDRYQVHLDVRVGGELIPLMARRMSSDGRITAQGLAPTRYDEETRLLLREVRRQTIVFEPDRVLTPRGGVQPTLEGIQDTASQFVQLTWMFTTQPERLVPGQTIEVPLALTRRVDRWIYDVIGQETLDTPVGRIPAWYLRPRPQNKTPNDLAVETWFAPTLQYLPVRIRIRQDDASFIDLMLERPPQQEAPRRPG